MPNTALSEPSILPDKNKLLGLDHLRAFAIAFVVLFHYRFFGHPEWVSKVSGFGWTGVDLFFVLSGFLIAGQLFETVKRGAPVRVGEFFIKRFFRIIPPYFVVLILYFSFPALSEWGHLSPMWRYLTFTLNFGLDLQQFGTFSHAWSLCVEEQFYLILPLCFWLFTNFKAGSKSIYFIVALFIAGFIIRYLCWKYQVEPGFKKNDGRPLFNLYIYYPTYNRLDGLLTGVSIAGLFTFYPKVKEWVNKYNNWILLVGIIAIATAYFVCADMQGFKTALYGFTLVSVAYGIILAAMVSPANILYKAKSVVTSQIAALSYSIYLIHKIVIHVTQVQLDKLGVDKNSNLMMLCCFAATILGAVLMRYAIEKPALRLRNSILLRMKQGKVAS